MLAAALLAGVAVAGLLQRGADAGSAGSGPAGPAPGPASAPASAGPVPLVPVDAPDAGSPDCARLVAALPGTLASGGATLPRRRIADPAPPATAAWGGSAAGDAAGDDPVVLRCGLARPVELTPTSTLLVVSAVQWLQLAGAGASSWVAVDRPVYVVVTLPADAGTGPLQDISAAVRATLTAVPVRATG